MLGKAMSFFLLPFISYYLAPEELGIATNFTVLTSLLILLAGIALVNSLPYFFYEQTRTVNRIMVSNLLFLCLTLCLLISILMLCCRSIIFSYLQLNNAIVLLAVLFVFFNIVTQTSLIIIRLENLPKLFACFQITQILIHALVVVLFVIYYKWGGLGKIYAEVLVFFLLGCAHVFWLLKHGYLMIKFDFSWIVKLLKFGLPLLPHSVSFWFKSGSDKVFITTFCGLYYNGLYSMALTICSIYSMLTHSFFNAYTPYLQKRISGVSLELEKTEKNAIVKQIYIIYFIFFFVSIIAVFGAWIIINYFIDNKYSNSFHYVPILILSYYIYTMYSFTIQFIYKAKKTMVMGIITFCGSLLQTLLSYLLIQRCGVIGAAYSLLVGNTIVTSLIFIYSNRVFPMPWFSISIWKKQSDLCKRRK